MCHSPKTKNLLHANEIILAQSAAHHSKMFNVSSSMLALAKLSRASICRAFNRIYRTTAHTHTTHITNLISHIRCEWAQQTDKLAIYVWMCGKRGILKWPTAKYNNNERKEKKNSVACCFILGNMLIVGLWLSRHCLPVVS